MFQKFLLIIKNSSLVYFICVLYIYYIPHLFLTETILFSLSNVLLMMYFFIHLEQYVIETSF